MTKLVYGKNNQVKFKSEKEKVEAFRYLLSNTTNIEFVHENNQNQGAWAPEKRIHFESEIGVPDCLIENMTAGRGNLYGRINCQELIEALQYLKGFVRITDQDILNV